MHFQLHFQLKLPETPLSADVFLQPLLYHRKPDSNSPAFSVSAGTVFCADAARINCVASLLFPSRNALLLVVKSVVSVTSSGVFSDAVIPATAPTKMLLVVSTFVSLL